MDHAPPPTRHAPWIDPGWPFLVAGLLLIGATILIPAARELDQAKAMRDRALAYEGHRLERIARYEEYLGAIERAEPSLVMSLAASQLGQIPEDRGLISRPIDGRDRNASVFPALEPPGLTLRTPAKVESRLGRLATGERSRVWMIAAGGACVLVGLFPLSSRRVRGVGA